MVRAVSVKTSLQNMFSSPFGAGSLDAPPSVAQGRPPQPSSSWPSQSSLLCKLASVPGRGWGQDGQGLMTGKSSFLSPHAWDTEPISLFPLRV